MNATGNRNISISRRSALWFALCLSGFAGAARAQSPPRLAVVDLAGDAGGEIASLLRASAGSSAFGVFELIDPALVRAAARGAGYAGNLNLSRDEARALGLSLGCDFYVLGKLQIARRMESGEKFHIEALAGLFFIETRTGCLIRFAFERVTAGDEPAALDRLKTSIRNAWAGQARAILTAREKHASEVENLARTSAPVIQVIEILPDGQASGQPVFYQRLKPVYTEQAELADVAATVELEAVFQGDGRVGDVEVVRWAGFGLDESAIATVRQLRFKPAELNGKVVTIRGLVRYNFRRPQSQADRPLTTIEIERLKRGLRDVNLDIKGAGPLPGQRPEF